MQKDQQKFKKGDICYLRKGLRLSSGESEYEWEGEVCIVGSYADLYWGNNRMDYSVIFTDTGNSLAWCDESTLSFIRHEGPKYIEHLKLRRLKIKEERTKLQYIVENWNNGHLSSDQILAIFEIISFPTHFIRNGEYYSLFMEWRQVVPFIDAMIKGCYDEVSRVLKNTDGYSFKDNMGKLNNLINEINS